MAGDVALTTAAAVAGAGVGALLRQFVPAMYRRLNGNTPAPREIILLEDVRDCLDKIHRTLEHNGNRLVEQHQKTHGMLTKSIALLQVLARDFES